jgi:citrate synthase
MSWLTAEQALALLGTKPQTLYANVSRGRIRAKADPANSRRGLYHSEDIKRLSMRQAGRRKTEAVAAQTIEWGDPILPSAISTVAEGRLFYRGQDATALAQRANLEEVAALLWASPAPPEWSGQEKLAETSPALRTAFLALAERAATDLPSLGRSPLALRGDAGSVLGTIADALAPSSSARPLHERLARSWDRAEAADAIRHALVLLADHELNASTFAARVTVSTGASLSAAVLSGLATLTGPLHGGIWQSVGMLADSAERIGAGETVRLYLAQGMNIPSFGHPLYPNGDIRAKTLLAQFTLPPVFAQLQNAVEDMVGERASVDFALAALSVAFDLPKDAALSIFALARSVGWLAHALEQAGAGKLIRPRAHYTGLLPDQQGATSRLGQRGERH